jgi:hypothetical protein
MDKVQKSCNSENYSVVTSAKGGQFKGVMCSLPLLRNSTPVIHINSPILYTEILHSYEDYSLLRCDAVV